MTRTPGRVGSPGLIFRRSYTFMYKKERFLQRVCLSVRPSVRPSVRLSVCNEIMEHFYYS